MERAVPLLPTPDTGALRTDLERLLIEGSALLRRQPVQAMFEVLLAQSTNPSTEISRARDRFLAAHMGRGAGYRRPCRRPVRLPAGTDPAVLVELVFGPALMRTLLMGLDIDAASAAEIVARAEAALASGERVMMSKGSGKGIRTGVPHE